jgi:hypothetical protein
VACTTICQPSVTQSPYCEVQSGAVAMPKSSVAMKVTRMAYQQYVFLNRRSTNL